MDQSHPFFFWLSIFASFATIISLMLYLFERSRVRDLRDREDQKLDEWKSGFYSHNNTLYGYFDRVANLSERVLKELYRKDEDGIKEAFKRTGEIRGAADSGRIQTQNYAKERLGREAFVIPPWDRSLITREHALDELKAAGSGQPDAAKGT